MPDEKARNAKSKAAATKATDKKPKRTYPLITLEEALKVPQAIRNVSKGHPAPTDDVAKDLGMSRNTNKFFYLSSAARDYGLTIGTRDTDEISLTDLGREIEYAEKKDVQRAKMIEAFFRVERFKQVYDHYSGSDLPEAQYLVNALEQKFQIPEAQQDEFVAVFKANCTFLGIEKALKASSASVPQGTSDALNIRVIGQPQGEFDRTAFVIMPFSEKGKQERPKGFFDEVLKSLITPAANAAGFAVQTARREDSDIIHHTIINQLLNAHLVIADMTDHNPNVFVELGIRLAKEKPVVLIKSKDTGPVFDVDHLMRPPMS
jgi:hypothetical protein